MKKCDGFGYGVFTNRSLGVNAHVGDGQGAGPTYDRGHGPNWFRAREGDGYGIATETPHEAGAGGHEIIVP